MTHHAGALSWMLRSTADLWKTDDIDLGMGGDRLTDRVRLRSALGRQQLITGGITGIRQKSPRRRDRAPAPDPNTRFYNVFYMTVQEFDIVVVGSGASQHEVAALVAAHESRR